MGLFADTLRGLFTFSTETKQAIASMVPTWQIGVPQTPLINMRSYEQVTRKGYLGSEVVFACCQAIAKSAASPAMVAYTSHDQNNPETTLEHPSLDLLRRPNKWWTHYQLWASTVVALKIAGNAYWERVRDRTGNIVEYWPLRPDRVWVVPDAKDYIRGYEYRLGADVFFLKPEDVIHFRNPHPLNDYYGLAPLSVLIERIDIDVWTREFTTAFFRNAGVPSGLLNIMRSVEPNEREIIRQRFRQQYGGPDGWGNVLVIDNGQASYTKLGMDPGTIGLNDINQITESRICAVMDVPPSIIWTVLGHQSASGLNNSNKQSDQTQWWTGALAPMYEDLAQQYSLASQEDFPDIDHFGFDLSQVPGYAKDIDTEHARVRADFAAGLVTWDQAVSLLGYEVDKPGWIVLPSTVIPTPSIQMAHYKEGQAPPGQPALPTGQMPGESEPGGGTEEGGSPEGEGGGGGQGGGAPAAAGAGPTGGAGETMMARLTTDGNFEIVAGCTKDARGEHYRSIQMGVCAWCGEDPFVLKSAQGHEFSSTQLNLPGQLSKELTEWAREHIDTDDLGSEGFETAPHVTVKYGIMPNVGPSDVARVLKGQQPVRMSFGPNHVFAGQDEGGGVPLYVSVNSDDVSRLNRRLKGALPNIETHAQYTPHVTIAYLKPDAVSKYVGGRSPLYGMHVTLGDLTYSGKDGRVVSIPLQSKALNEGLDSAGGIFVPPQNGKPRRKRNAKELWDLLDDWKERFELGTGDLEEAVKALEPQPYALAGWLYSYATGKLATKQIDGETVEYKAGNLDALLEYWRDRFDGGTPGDFDECVSTLNDKVDDPEALCAWLHHEATGYWPGQAPSEKNGKLNVQGWEMLVVDSRDELTKRVQAQVRQMEISLASSGTPVQAFRPGSQNWLTLVETPRNGNGHERKYSPDQPRDERGRFGEGGGGGSGPAYGDHHSTGSAHNAVTAEDTKGWLNDEKDSQHLYKTGDTAGKDYTQARLDNVHDPAIDRAMHGVYEKHEDGVAGGGMVPESQGPLTVTAMGGGGAAGKSSALDKGAIEGVPDKDHAVWSNADWNKEKDLPEYKAMTDKGEKEAAALMHEESSDLAAKVVHEALTNNRDTVVDAVMDSSMAKLTDKVQGWRNDGAQVVNAHYLTVPIPQAVAAAQARAEKTGREVPLGHLTSAHASVNGMLHDVLHSNTFDNMTIHDNTGYNPVLVASRTNGQVTIHRPDLYENMQRRADPSYTG